jgi:sugar phosphate isomerase/epimerase
MKRREFIQSSSLLAAGAMVFPSLTFTGCAKTKFDIGIQLYTLRDVIPGDPKGVLKKIADAGYTTLETYSYADGSIFGMNYVEFSKYANSLGLKITSGHYPLALAKTADAWEKAVVDAKTIGQDYMVVPYLNAPERTSIDDYKGICAALNTAGEVCNKHGVRFGYHNHDFEFQAIDGQVPYDLMLKELDPEKVGMEMDLYWVVFAGLDPIAYFEKYPGRFEQWHVKDMDKADKAKNDVIGAGSIDYKALFAKATESGLKRFYVEQETYKGASLDTIKPSADFLKTIL